MADVLPINFPLPSESALASYSYTDIADGTGVVMYYGVRTITNAGDDFILTTSPFIAPGPVATKVRLYETDGQKDFDLTAFTSPRTLRGTAYISCQSYSANTPYIVARIYKYSGGVETAISSEITSQQATKDSECFLIPIPLTTTNFGIGDILRVKIEVQDSGGVAIDPSLTVETHDPLKIYIPYEIRL